MQPFADRYVVPLAHRVELKLLNFYGFWISGIGFVVAPFAATYRQFLAIRHEVLRGKSRLEKNAEIYSCPR